MLVHLAIPRPGHSSQAEGCVHSVYVVPSHRRRGVARAIMDEAMRYAREARLLRLTLHPSDEARPLYEALGFVALDEMGFAFTEADH